MRLSRFEDLMLSGLALGTVQFGLRYGVANKLGQPSYETAREITACAFENGVNCFDTASLYGTSEETLGRIFADLKIADRVAVATKVQYIANDLGASDADRLVEESVLESLRRLNMDRLDVCLFHRTGNHRYMDSLHKMKEKGLVRHVGASVVEPADASEALRMGAEVLEMPTSILDHRFTTSGVLGDVAAGGKCSLIRSIYQQGLLLMPDEETPEELAGVVPVRRRLSSLAGRAGMGLAELAVRYALTLHGVTCAIVGVDSVEQMRENVRLFSAGPLDAGLMQSIRQAVDGLPEIILKPYTWSMRMPDPKL